MALLKDNEGQEFSCLITSSKDRAIKEIDENVGKTAACGEVINSDGKVIHTK